VRVPEVAERQDLATQPAIELGRLVSGDYRLVSTTASVAAALPEWLLDSLAQELAGADDPLPGD
jgi:hypothetical protein